MLYTTLGSCQLLWSPQITIHIFPWSFCATWQSAVYRHGSLPAMNEGAVHYLPLIRYRIHVAMAGANGVKAERESLLRDHNHPYIGHHH